MAKPGKSQWDFGELFPAETPVKPAATVVPASVPAQLVAQATPVLAQRHVLTVGELTGQVRRLLEKQVGEIWVTGEVTNLRSQSSGHFYFTIKDAESQLSCVLFRDEARANKGLLQDGRKVVLQGTLTVYEARGQYQLRVETVELQGIGALQAAFERLKEKLKGEGLFAMERKRALPRYPRRIGIVSSITGAAIRDVLHVIQRRHPALEIVFIHCKVQGQEAAEEIAAAINSFNHYHAQGAQVSAEANANALDLILVTRGGGSLEDLWAFNEEAVARAIFNSLVPVVSAVGHEIDFSISDFVADLRAATPSAAAELITEGFFASRDFVAYANLRLQQLAAQQLESKNDALDQLHQRLARKHPRRVINEALQRLDDLQAGLVRQARQVLETRKLIGESLMDRLQRLNPKAEIRRRRERFEQCEKRFHEHARRHLLNRKNDLATLEMRLRLLGPEQVLARGYSITTRAKDGKIVRAAAEVSTGDELITRLKSGAVKSIVKE